MYEHISAEIMRFATVRTNNLNSSHTKRFFSVVLIEIFSKSKIDRYSTKMYGSLSIIP